MPKIRHARVSVKVSVPSLATLSRLASLLRQSDYGPREIYPSGERLTAYCQVFLPCGRNLRR